MSLSATQADQLLSDKMNCTVRFGKLFSPSFTHVPALRLVPCCQGKLGELTKNSLQNLMYNSFCRLVLCALRPSFSDWQTREEGNFSSLPPMPRDKLCLGRPSLWPTWKRRYAKADYLGHWIGSLCWRWQALVENISGVCVTST